MSRLVAKATSLLLFLAACTGASGITSSSTTTSTTSTSTSTSAEPAIELGQLVVVDEAGDIVVVDPDGSDREAITTDGGDVALYSQPIWSADGLSLAWGQVTSDGFAVGLRAMKDDSSRTVPTPHLPFYLHWSPDGRRLGALHDGSDGLDFTVVDVPDATASAIDGGSPFYFSWSPDGEHLVTHVGDDRFEKIAPDGSREALGPTGAGYLAPQWTPAGIFHVVDDYLVLEQHDGDRQQIAEVGEFTLFVVNRQGTHVALQSTGGTPGISVGLVEVAAIPGDVVVVVDVVTGESRMVTQRPALGFFWSPDGDSVLTMTPTGEGMQATVWDLDGTSTDYSVFRPSVFLVRDLFPFFPQYAQSMSFWSPDSSAFAYASDDGIWVQKLGEDQPTKVSNGTWVAWSH